MAQQPTPGSNYTVVSGDTLWGIAQRAYSDPEDWDTIYAANKQVVGNNPNLIYPGQVLSIPKESDPTKKKPVPPQDPYPSTHAPGHGPVGPPPPVDPVPVVTQPPYGTPTPVSPGTGDGGNILDNIEDKVEGEIKEALGEKKED